MAPHGPQGEDQNASTGVEIPTLYILTIPPSHAATLAASLFLIPPHQAPSYPVAFACALPAADHWPALLSHSLQLLPNCNNEVRVRGGCLFGFGVVEIIHGEGQR